MKKAFFFQLQFAIVMVVIGLGSCNSSSNTNPSDNATKIDSTAPQAKAVAAAPTPPITDDELDELYIDAKKFAAYFTDHNSKKITFVFYITDKKSLTIQGWPNDNGKNDFDPDPQIYLESGVKSGVHLDPKTSLNNQILKVDDLNKLLGDIKKGLAWVVFSPEKDAKGFLIYNIQATNLDPRGAKVFSKTLGNSYPTNPSPPRTTAGNQ